MNLFTWLLIVLAVLLFGFMLWMRRGVANMSASEVERRLAAGERLVIVDVRGPAEYASGHIPGSLSIPLPVLDQAAPKLDPGAETVLVCGSGNRSLVAYHRLKAKGFTRLRNMPGGMLGWQGPKSRT